MLRSSVVPTASRGLNDSQIKEFLLDPTDDPVESYVQSMLVRLGLRSRTELMPYARSLAVDEIEPKERTS